MEKQYPVRAESCDGKWHKLPKKIAKVAKMAKVAKGCGIIVAFKIKYNKQG